MKRLGQEQQSAREYAEGIVDTVREPLIVLDASLRVISANQSFYGTFKVSPDETVNKYLYELGNGQWDIPELKIVLGSVITEAKTFRDFRVEHEFPALGRKVMLINARGILREGKPHQILLAIEDVTEGAPRAGHRAARSGRGRERQEERGDLRTRAEALIAGTSRGAPADTRTYNEVLHELLVHQIELEMQNEELRRARDVIEESRPATRTSTISPLSPTSPSMRTAASWRRTSLRARFSASTGAASSASSSPASSPGAIRTPSSGIASRSSKKA